jgi:hypothetical protein
VWTVALNGKLVNGDRGTWVIAAKTGGLYDHFVSGNPELGVAYILPADQIFKDIRHRFGGDDVELFLGLSLFSHPNLTQSKNPLIRL